MAFLIPEAGIAGVEGIESFEGAKEAEAVIPKMEKPAEKSSTLKDLFLYKSMQPTQAPQPVIINNQNIQQVAQPVAQATPIMEPPPETKTETDNNIVSIQNNKIIIVEQAQISSEANQIDQLSKQPPTKSTQEKLQELMDIYETNLSIFHNQLDRANGYFKTTMYQ